MGVGNWDWPLPNLYAMATPMVHVVHGCIYAARVQRPGTGKKGNGKMGNGKRETTFDCNNTIHTYIYILFPTQVYKIARTTLYWEQGCLSPNNHGAIPPSFLTSSPAPFRPSLSSFLPFSSPLSPLPLPLLYWWGTGTCYLTWACLISFRRHLHLHSVEKNSKTLTCGRRQVCKHTHCKAVRV